MIYSFKGYKPVVDKTAFVHPQASVTGNVTIGKNVFIGSGAAIRGDFGQIIIEDGCNVQENCIIHMFPGATVLLKKGAHIGHGSIVHGATIGKNVLVGMHTVIMDNVVVGDDSIIGAMSLLTEGMQVPSRKVVVGHPAKIIREVSDEMLKWKTEGTAIYNALPAECMKTMKACKPLRKVQAKKKQSGDYKTWKKTKR
jgi:carbonic anhydrase/acetyltransferase-like protein (isoleucine patch superfamily)